MDFIRNELLGGVADAVRPAQNKSTTANSSCRPLPGKKAYNRPALHVYGALHLLTQGSRGTRFDANFTMRPRTSDRITKENIVKIGMHPLGIGLYLFDYKPEYRGVSGYGRQFGVMADEVENVMPEAVSRHADGYKMVNYAMLGISQAIQ
jgi:hypothetical protein